MGRGPWPMPVTILKGLTQSGVTLHKMENELDAGDILLQEAFEVAACDNLETMTEKICEIGSRLCKRMVENFSRYWECAKPQGNYEYWKEPPKEEYTITSDTPPEMTERILRAFYGFECFLRVSDSCEISVIRGKYLSYKHSLPFGTEFFSDGYEKGYAVNGGIVVLCD
jgi:methionyl-tRNA formyltransferase